MTGIRIINCREEVHAGAILAILNEAIVNSTAIYDYRPRPPESMSPWFAAKRAHGYPIVGAEDASGELIGFGTYGQFRDRPAYKYTVEHSVYVEREHRGRGVGRAILQHLIEIARAKDLHVLVGGIDASNKSSITFHEHLGFRHAGTIQQAGFKFGRWLDLAFYQLILNTPQNPSDG
jgi:L-amino acid N-acyltransferase